MGEPARKWEETEAGGPQLPGEKPRLAVVDGGQTQAQAEDGVHPHAAAASVTAGVLGLVAWIIPLFGLPLTIFGFVQGWKAYQARRSPTAVVGAFLCGMGLFFSTMNAILGAYLGATGRHPMVQEDLGDVNRSPAIDEDEEYYEESEE